MNKIATMPSTSSKKSIPTAPTAANLSVELVDEKVPSVNQKKQLLENAVQQANAN